jgi:hypothetical protein
LSGSAKIRTVPSFALFAAAILLAAGLHADIIDRIAASVDSRVITQSELERQIRVAAFQDGAKPDLSAAHKKATLQTLIDQKLIQLDLENSRYPAPEASELNPVVDQFKKEHFPTEGAYQRELADYGITDADFRDLLLWQRTLLSFIEVRFTSGVQITDKEIEDYFDKTVKPAAEAAHSDQPVRLDDYRAQIEKNLAAQRADRQLETWLAGARRRTQIIVHEEVLK